MADEKITHNENVKEESLALTPSGGLHHDEVAAEALGGHTGDLPDGYYRSLSFIGTVIVSVPGIRYTHTAF